jgi:hypothetical protein
MILPMRISFDLDGVLADMDTALATIAEREFGVSVPSPESSPRPLSLPLRSGQAGQADPGVTSPEPVGGAGEGGSPQAPSNDVSNQRLAATAPDALPTAAVLPLLSARQQTQLWSRVRETPDFWETLVELEPGSVRRLQRLAHDLAWEVLFVTQRPSTAGDTAQVQSQRWLTKHGFEFPAVYTTRGSRGRIAAALTLDAHIDDRLDNALDVATDSRAWSILVWRDEASAGRVQVNAKRMNIAVVRSVGDALDKLEQADRSVRDGWPGRAGSEGNPAEGSAIVDRLKRVFGFGR